MRPLSHSRGFTLVELVMVVVLLGVMATFASQFISTSTLIYRDAGQREQLMSDARFALERFNRELRDAVPGSARVEALDGSPSERGQCLRFWPITTSSRYLALNALQPSPYTLLMVSPEQLPLVGDRAIVYPIPGSSTHELGCDGNCVAKVTALGAVASGAQSLTVDKPFATDSPARRIYFAREQVLYCVRADRLWRGEASLDSNLGSDDTAQLMAEHIQRNSWSFYHEPDGFSQEGALGLRLVFERNGEAVTFNHKVEVFNAP